MRKAHTLCKTTSTVHNPFKMCCKLALKCTLLEIQYKNALLARKTCVAKILYSRETLGKIRLQNTMNPLARCKKFKTEVRHLTKTQENLFLSLFTSNISQAPRNFYGILGGHQERTWKRVTFNLHLHVIIGVAMVRRKH